MIRARIRGQSAVSAAPPDGEAPAAQMLSPSEGDGVSGAITVAASASDNVAVSYVLLQESVASGAYATIATISVAPYSTSWTVSAALGTGIRYRAIAYDPTGNNTTTAPVSVTRVSAAASTIESLFVTDTSGTQDISFYMGFDTGQMPTNRANVAVVSVAGTAVPAQLDQIVYRNGDVRSAIVSTRMPSGYTAFTTARVTYNSAVARPGAWTAPTSAPIAITLSQWNWPQYSIAFVSSGAGSINVVVAGTTVAIAAISAATDLAGSFVSALEAHSTLSAAYYTRRTQGFDGQYVFGWTGGSQWGSTVPLWPKGEPGGTPSDYAVSAAAVGGAVAPTVTRYRAVGARTVYYAGANTSFGTAESHWLDGDLYRETRFRFVPQTSAAAAHPHLMVWIHCRWYRDGTLTWWDVHTEHPRMRVADPIDYFYSPTIFESGVTAYAPRNLPPHINGARWRYYKARPRVWWMLGAAAKGGIVLPTLNGSVTTESPQYSLVRDQSPEGGSDDWFPLVIRGRDLYSGAGGSHAGDGPYNEESGKFLYSTDNSVKAYWYDCLLITGSQAAGSLQFHWRDDTETTARAWQQVDIRSHWRVVMGPDFVDATDKIQEISGSPSLWWKNKPPYFGENPWPAISHSPSPAHLGAVLTGDRWLHDEQKFRATFDNMCNGTGYREPSSATSFHRNLILTNNGVRSFGYSMRDLAVAAGIVATDDARKAYWHGIVSGHCYFLKAVENNNALGVYVQNMYMSNEGVVTQDRGGTPWQSYTSAPPGDIGTAVAPWMEMRVLMGLTMATRFGISGAQTALNTHATYVANMIRSAPRIDAGKLNWWNYMAYNLAISSATPYYNPGDPNGNELGGNIDVPCSDNSACYIRMTELASGRPGIVEANMTLASVIATGDFGSPQSLRAQCYYGVRHACDSVTNTTAATTLVSCADQMEADVTVADYPSIDYQYRARRLAKVT